MTEKEMDVLGDALVTCGLFGGAFVLLFFDIDVPLFGVDIGGRWLAVAFAGLGLAGVKEMASERLKAVRSPTGIVQRLSETQSVLGQICTPESANALLARLAREFYDCTEEEGRIAAAAARDDCRYDALASAQELTHVAKRQFWSAHEIISQIDGIEVKKSYKDYLSEEIRMEEELQSAV